MVVTVPPIRKRFGDVDPEPIPLTYPSEFLHSFPHFLREVIQIEVKRKGYVAD